MNKDVSNFCRWRNKNLVAILEGYTRISSNNCCTKWINLNNIEKKMVATWVLCLLGSKVCLQCSADHLLVCVQRLFGFFHWLSSSPRHVFSASYVCSSALFVACSAPLVRCSAAFAFCWLRLVGCLQAHVVDTGCVSLVNLCLWNLMTGFRKTKMT